MCFALAGEQALDADSKRGFFLQFAHNCPFLSLADFYAPSWEYIVLLPISHAAHQKDCIIVYDDTYCSAPLGLA
jgi:hypothetical protein